MDISLGFLVILFLILFPGLIFRRLYFYGEFSKQFKSEYNLISLIAISAIPGIVNLILIYLFYDNFFSDIDLGEIIDKLKDINNPKYRFTESNDTPIKVLLNAKAAPFVSFLYVSSILFGAISGRFIRITKIDTKFKLLRFKNYWFYLFNGQHTDFKKMKHLKKRNKRQLFTKADILIDSNNKTHLYSGIVVDYELQDKDCKALSKIMLQNAERYSLKNGKREPVEIPGNLLVVDCTSMKNINLTYIYEETKNILKSKTPNTVEIIFGLIVLLLIPIFLFQSDSIDWGIYQDYFKLKWYEKFIAYFITIQSLSLLNPFIKTKGEYTYVNIKIILFKLLWLGFLSFLLWWIN
jgi:hypothetical protein